MRWRVVVMLLCAGCAFQVPGVGPGPSVGGGSAPAGNDNNIDPGDTFAPVAGLDPGPAPPAPPAPTPTPTPTPDAGTMVPESSHIGDACDDKNKACPTGQVCETKTSFGSDIPGGYCTLSCSTTPCPSDAQCTVPWGTTRVCLENCPAAGCRIGYLCCKNGWAAPGVCLTAALCPNG
jgi:hypothetical protein